MTAGKPASAGVAPEQIVTEAIDLYRDAYESCIAYLDRQVGQLLQSLERRGSLENTLVIVTSDHGEHFGEHGLLGHGLSLYRREVHVPLLLLPPSRLAAPQVVSEPVSLREIPATVADWVDLGSRNPFPGRSLARFMGRGGSQLPEPTPVLTEVQQIKEFAPSALIPSSLGPVSSLVSRGRVYIQSDGGREELFDLWNDPLELGDLANAPDSGPELRRLREELSRLARVPRTPAR